jgi:hypothetical protein
MSGLASHNDESDFADCLMFPPRQHSYVTQSLLDIDSRTASMCDLTKPTGVGLAMLDLDPLATAYFSRMDRNRDEC